MKTENSKILIIGIGNEFRSDDACGLIAAKKLKRKMNTSVRIIEHSDDGASLMEEWKDYDDVLIIDAVCLGKKPGTIHAFNANKEKLPSEKTHHSSHIFGLNDAVETARALNKLPANLRIYGIEGKSFAAGTAVSSLVQKGIDEVVNKIVEYVRK